MDRGESGGGEILLNVGYEEGLSVFVSLVSLPQLIQA
jgi:hypothetical protein